VGVLVRVDLPACRVRFVMRRGAYAVGGGTVEQRFDGDGVTVHDVRVPVKANSEATVDITPSRPGK